MREDLAGYIEETMAKRKKKAEAKKSKKPTRKARSSKKKAGSIWALIHQLVIRKNQNEKVQAGQVPETRIVRK